MRNYRGLLAIILIFSLSSCKVFYPNWMLRENRTDVYIEIAKQQAAAELITPGDRMNFILKSRDGYELVDVLEGSQSIILGQNAVTYLVREDGNVDLPLLGDIKVVGMTRKQLEDLLEKKYSNIYNDPFVVLTIINHHAFVFMGRAAATVVPLPGENTKLIEVLAMVGGIHEGAKSNKIRIIRGSYEHPQVKHIDLSTIEGLRDAEFIVQPNDLIIVDPTTKVVPAILQEVTPFLSLITTVLTFYLIFRK